jgi:hypothetical protein
MLPKPEGLVSWLMYQDIVPQRGPRVLVQGFGEEAAGEPEQVGWLRYGWDVACALVALPKKEAALSEEFQPGFRISPGWWSDDQFDFGERMREGGYDLEAFIYQYKHPLKNALIVDLRQDFIRYHKLDRPRPEVYVHPGEGLEVAWIRFPGHPDQLAGVEVHLDFLRDYSAARHRAMLLRFVADRFANLHEVKQLGLKAIPKTRVSAGDFRQIDIYEHEGGFWRVRSTLWKAFLIEPYPKPKVKRNPWHIRLDNPNPTPHQFYLDQQGNRRTLASEAHPLYLHFRREVLRHYLQSEGFRVGFHMRKWGIAANPHGNGVDVGINTEGQVTAFALDILRLPEPEQAHWASYSCFPSGDVCRELFQTRMQCDPPHSPHVVELVRDAKDTLNKSLFALAGANLYGEAEPAEKDLCALTVGPLNDELAEVARLSKVLYQMAVESMDVGVLRKAVSRAQPPDGEKWGSIRYLQELVAEASGCGPAEAAAAVQPLKHLNEL